MPQAGLEIIYVREMQTDEIIVALYFYASHADYDAGS